MILAIDVGKGTEDILLLDESKPIENTIQIVLPSTAQILRDQLYNDDSDLIFISGSLMAGEPWHKVVYDKCAENPNSVIMTETAARSLRYNLDQVRAKKVKILSDSEFDKEYEKNKKKQDEIKEFPMYPNRFSISHYSISDINFDRIEAILAASDIDPNDISKVLLCVQDHGEPVDANQSARDYRMSAIYSRLDNNGRLEDLMFRSDEIPQELPRLNSVAESVLKYFSHLSTNDVYVMDSSPSVVLGVVGDLYPKDITVDNKHLIVNLGNGHTLAAFMKGDVVELLYELHTGGLITDSFFEELDLILKGKLTHEDVLQKGAHGIYRRNNPDENQIISTYLPILVIGPNREKIKNIHDEISFSHPGGSMMMSGPLGLIRAFNYLSNKN
jgi:uncharacterized protein (DUF1786 family)